jgi:S1-C subfamily serine protease
MPKALLLAVLLTLASYAGFANSTGVLLPSLAPVIKAASPAVVNIATRGTVSERAPANPLREDPYFRRYFAAPGGAVRLRQFQSAGSGVIVDAKNGYSVEIRLSRNGAERTVALTVNPQSSLNRP